MNQVEIGLERMEHNWKRMSQYPQMKERRLSRRRKSHNSFWLSDSISFEGTFPTCEPCERRVRYNVN